MEGGSCQLPLSKHGHLLAVGLASPQEVLPRLGADVSPTAAKEHLRRPCPEPQPSDFFAEPSNQVCVHQGGSPTAFSSTARDLLQSPLEE